MNPILSTADYYTFSEASTMLNCTKRQLYNYYHQGVIVAILHQRADQHRQVLMLSNNEVNRIQSKLATPSNQIAIDIATMAKQQKLTENAIKSYIHTLGLVPYKILGLTNSNTSKHYYTLTDYQRIKTIIIKRNYNQINLNPTNSHHYDHQIDYSIHTLGRYLNVNHPIDGKTIMRYLKQHLINDYSVDVNHKVYFTLTQAKQIKAQYQKLLANIDCTHDQLAQRLHVKPNSLLQFRQSHQLAATKIMGYRELYYTKAQALIITKLYQKLRRKP